MEEKNQDVYEIDLLQMFGILTKRWWIIVASSVVCAVIAFIYTFQFVTPMYQTKVMLYVNNSSLSVGSARLNLSSGDLAARQELVQTYGVILKANLTLQDIEETLSSNQNLNHEYTYKDLDRMISSDAAEGTEIMEITVTCPDYSDAVIIADTVAQVLPTRIARIVEGTSVKVVDLAEFPTAPSSPSYPKNCLIGFLLGLVLSSAAILVYVLLIQDRIDSDEWLRKTYGEKIPVLAIIPEIGMKKGNYYNYGKYYARYGYSSDTDENAQSQAAQTSQPESDSSLNISKEKIENQIKEYAGVIKDKFNTLKNKITNTESEEGTASKENEQTYKYDDYQQASRPVVTDISMSGYSQSETSSEDADSKSEIDADNKKGEE